MSIFNVKDYGNAETGRAGVVLNAGMTLASPNDVTSASNPWTAGDVGKKIYIGGNVSPFTPVFPLAGATITAFISAGHIQVDGPGTTATFVNGSCWWGQDDSQAFIDAKADAAADVNGVGTVFVPTGNYIIRQRIFNGAGQNFVGQSKESVQLLVATDFDAPADGNGAVIESNGDGAEITGFTLRGSKCIDKDFSDGQAFVRLRGTSGYYHDFNLRGVGSSGGNTRGVDFKDCALLRAANIYCQIDPSLGYDSSNLTGVRFYNSYGVVENLLSSNFTLRNLLVTENAIGTGGLSGPAGILQFVGGLIDENTTGGNFSVEILSHGALSAVGWTAWTNGDSVNGYAVHVDGTSQLILANADLGPFQISGRGALKLDAGGECRANGTIFRAGGAQSVSVANAGKFVDSPTNRYRHVVAGAFADVNWRSALSSPTTVWRG